MAARLISYIKVEKLFGLYTYKIPETGELSNAAILYGDNGVGKSTLLRLVFHLLSAAHNRGRRGEHSVRVCISFNGIFGTAPQ